MALRLYNTLTRSKEVFETLEPNLVKMYVCGPTVYAEAHIGHAMSALVFDIIRRYLEYSGYDVKYVMNYTDVDDKIIDKARQLGQDPYQLAQRYIDDYAADLEALNVLPASVNPRATEEMDYILKMVSSLLEEDRAYAVDGDVYFRVDRDADYGKLSGRKLEGMEAGARIQVDERKEHPMDFALWKAAKPGEPAWESPWGMGRPGWHIECSAMNLHHLGEQIDIHGGGNDLIFPHHENEIAQTEAITGKPFARYWMHNGMLTLKNEKMSKSLGNMVTIREFLGEHPADVMRLMVIQSAYRNPLVYSEDTLGSAEQVLRRLLSAKKPAQSGASGLQAQAALALNESAQKARESFKAAMDDDFNTAGALAAVFELVKAINSARADGASAANLEEPQAVFAELTGVLGLQLLESQRSQSDAEPFIDLLLELRQDVRAEKNWAMSDKIRDGLKALGVLVKDGKDGSSWDWE